MVIADTNHRFDARPELRMVLDWAAVAIGIREKSALASRADADLDWDYLLEAARWHHLEPLVFKALDAKLAPPAHFRELAAQYKENARRNLHLAGLLIRILDEFDSQSIQVIPFKGVSLAVTCYGDLALRRFRDVDLLVDPADLAAAGQCLQGLGFEPVERPTAQERRLRLKTDKHELWFDKTGTLLELHWRLDSYHQRLPETPLRDLAKSSIRLGGETIPGLLREDLLVYLCFHGTAHLWFRLFWLADVAALIHRVPTLNWDAVLTRAAAWGQERPLALGLMLAKQLFGVALPSTLVPFLARHSAVENKVAKMLRFLLADQGRRPYEIAVTPWREFCWETALRPNPLSKAGVAFRWLLAPKPADLRAIPLPRALFPLYYVLRPSRLLWKYLFARQAK